MTKKGTTIYYPEVKSKWINITRGLAYNPRTTQIRKSKQATPFLYHKTLKNVFRYSYIYSDHLQTLPTSIGHTINVSNLYEEIQTSLKAQKSVDSKEIVPLTQHLYKTKILSEYPEELLKEARKGSPGLNSLTAKNRLVKLRLLLIFGKDKTEEIIEQVGVKQKRVTNILGIEDYYLFSTSEQVIKTNPSYALESHVRITPSLYSWLKAVDINKVSPTISIPIASDYTLSTISKKKIHKNEKEMKKEVQRKLLKIL